MFRTASIAGLSTTFMLFTAACAAPTEGSEAQGEEVESASELAELVEARSRVWRIVFNRGGRVSQLVIGG